MHVELAVSTDIAASRLDDAEHARAALEAGCAAGSFTVLEVVVRKFDPHGVTATAIVGESHLTLHTWPEHGSLFVDVASCSTREAARAGMDAILGAYGGRLLQRRADSMPLSSVPLVPTGAPPKE
ncbi:MAG: S-adenosylmethionine decarboxylase [Deltaproteobacteria bacterium]|nr:S-adenosylmethionine decarboxylase [Deltaproteobacteria bacterium]